jgi:hypothetical protein
MDQIVLITLFLCITCLQLVDVISEVENHNNSTSQRKRILPVDLDSVIKRQLASDIQCLHMPPKTIMMVASTYSSFDLILVQNQGIKTITNIEDQKCLIDKLIIICLDPKCMKLCRQHALSRCTRFIPRINDTALMNRTKEYVNDTVLMIRAKESLSLSGGTFKEKNWNHITYIKWEFMYKAIQLGAKTIFMIDADLLLLKNPFESTNNLLSKYDILYQTEHSSGNDCSATINSGLLFFHVSEKIIAIVNAMLSSKHEILNGNDLEQNILEKQVEKLKASKCAAPRKFFTGHCQYSHEDNVLASDIVTYHTSCGKNTTEKIALMRHFMRFVHIPNATFNHAELYRWYFDKSLAIPDPDKPAHPVILPSTF